MKIIQPGRPQRGWSREETCTGAGNGGGGCGAVLLVEEPDMYTTRSCDYSGDCETFTTFMCCACGVETDMRNVPSAVHSRLKPKPRP